MEKRDLLLKKLQIDKLNPMQMEAIETISKSREVIIVSPTGTGKTLAYILPILDLIKENIHEVQAVIVVPTRELAIQQEQVLRRMASGIKVNCVYGGQAFSKDVVYLQHRPDIIVGTPGRLADHMRRKTFSTEYVRTLVIDEYDKSLEIGFDNELQEITGHLCLITKIILTSATKEENLPSYIPIHEATVIDFSNENHNKLDVIIVKAKQKDKLDILYNSICHLANQNGIVFCNFKNAINRVSQYLTSRDIEHGCFHGDMEQREREQALIKFRNGTYNILLATDLAARGLDVPKLDFIIHYHLPTKVQEFTHRNGRTARVNQEGSAYILQGVEEILPDFIIPKKSIELSEVAPPTPPLWKTIFVSAGRKDKISKGDILGFLIKVAQIESHQIGQINVLQECAFIAVARDTVDIVIRNTDHQRVKKRKVRVRLA